MKSGGGGKSQKTTLLLLIWFNYRHSQDLFLDFLEVLVVAVLCVNRGEGEKSEIVLRSSTACVIEDYISLTSFYTLKSYTPLTSLTQSFDWIIEG